MLQAILSTMPEATANSSGFNLSVTPVTILVPINPNQLCRSLKGFKARSLLRLLAFHVVKGLYTQDSAVKALLLSKYSQAAPYLQILINTVNTVNATVNAPYTLLVPLEALDYCTTIKKYPSQQLLPLMAYHIVKGRFTYGIMNGFKNGKTLSTISGLSLSTELGKND
ncbi:unnamed protein product [Closterium sp. Yama58-4]|nr:unnamed protein product [Closterium sp. Yama58-4]